MKICLRSLMTAVWASAMTRTTARRWGEGWRQRALSQESLA